MSQYRTGTVAVTSASAVVTGSGTSWLTYVAVGDTFKIESENAIYNIASVDSDTQITLTTNYAGTTASSQSYQITVDFTPNLEIPEIWAGDLDWPYHLTNGLRLIDSLFAGALTDHGILLGSGTGAVTPMSVGTNGQLVKGVSASDPIWSTTTLTDGTNTFNLTNGTASLDVAAGATLNIDKSLTVDGQATTITGAGQANTITLNESITIGDGYSGTLTYSAASKTLTVEADSIVNQDLTSDSITAAFATADDNTATTRVATTAFAKSQDAVLAREPNQGVAMTYAASGSTGIRVADNANINFGTGNFTLCWKGSLPDWTLSEQYFLGKFLGTPSFQGFTLKIVSGKLRLQLIEDLATSKLYNIDTTSNIPFASNTTHEITAVVIPGTSATIYYDGYQIYQTTSIPTSYNITNSTAAYVSGSSSGRTASTTHHAYIFNRALSAAEVLDLYRNGIAYADKWGSQTELVVNGDIEAALATLNGVSITSTVQSTLSQSTDQAHSFTKSLKIVAAMPAANAFIIPNKAEWNGKYVTVEGWVYIPSTNTGQSVVVKNRVNGVSTSEVTISATDTWTKFSLTYIHGSTPSTDRDFFVEVLACAINDVYYLDDISFKLSGATLALEPEGINSNKWYDSSSNSLDASYPASGYSFTRSMEAITTSNVIAEGSSLVLKPKTDATTAVQVQTSGGTAVATIDTTNSRVGVGITPTSTLHNAGSFALPITTKTADYTAGASDYTILVSCSSANITITLPAVASYVGRIYNIKKIDATGYTVIIDGNSSETIDGALTQVISAQYESLQIQSSGSAWYII